MGGHCKVQPAHHIIAAADLRACHRHCAGQAEEPWQHWGEVFSVNEGFVSIEGRKELRDLYGINSFLKIFFTANLNSRTIFFIGVSLTCTIILVP